MPGAGTGGPGLGGPGPGGPGTVALARWPWHGGPGPGGRKQVSPLAGCRRLRAGVGGLALSEALGGSPPALLPQVLVVVACSCRALTPGLLPACHFSLLSGLGRSRPAWPRHDLQEPISKECHSRGAGASCVDFWGTRLNLQRAGRAVPRPSENPWMASARESSKE